MVVLENNSKLKLRDVIVLFMKLVKVFFFNNNM